MSRRVVVTGMAGLTALGEVWSDIRAAMEQGRTGTRTMPEWDKFDGLSTRLAAPIEGFSVEGRYPRKKLRSMGPVARMAVYATEKALESAGLLEDPVVQSGRMGIAYGSSFGSTNPVLDFAAMLTEGTMQKLNGTSYIRMMNHTAAVNIGVYFGCTGRIIPTSSACTSGSQGIGYAYEAIKFGRQDLMVAGGGEELCPSMAAAFDVLYATSVQNDKPETTPRPFDKDRDGLVVGEGAATLVLEELEHAKARGATICAEIVGFGTNSDGNHITQPGQETVEQALRLALADADLQPEAIRYVSGHGTATKQGDIAESHATANVLGEGTAINSLKSYFGHNLGASGAVEAWLAIEMMRDNWYAPTANLENVDPECANLNYIMGSGIEMDNEYIMTNNLAFGGINTSIIFRKSQ